MTEQLNEDLCNEALAQEFRAELAGIYQNIPVRMTQEELSQKRVDPTLIDRVVRRSNSQHRKELEIKLRGLLDKSLTTKSFQEATLYLFKEVYMLGRFSQNSTYKTYEDILFREAIGLSGVFGNIFTREGAKLNERSLFTAFQERFVDYSLGDLEDSNLLSEADRNLFSDYEEPTRLKGKLDIWRSEYKQHYQEDPPGLESYTRPQAH